MPAASGRVPGAAGGRLGAFCGVSAVQPAVLPSGGFRKSCLRSVSPSLPAIAAIAALPGSSHRPAGLQLPAIAGCSMLSAVQLSSGVAPFLVALGLAVAYFNTCPCSCQRRKFDLLKKREKRCELNKISILFSPEAIFCPFSCNFGARGAKIEFVRGWRTKSAKICGFRALHVPTGRKTARSSQKAAGGCVVGGWNCCFLRFSAGFWARIVSSVPAKSPEKVRFYQVFAKSAGVR